MVVRFSVPMPDKRGPNPQSSKPQHHKHADDLLPARLGYVGEKAVIAGLLLHAYFAFG